MQRRAMVCRDCLLVGPVITLPPRRREPRRKPTAYERLHTRVWGRLALEGEVFVTRVGQIVGRCPVCGHGVVCVMFIPTDPPRIRTEGCTDGCSPELVAQVL